MISLVSRVLQVVAPIVVQPVLEEQPVIEVVEPVDIFLEEVS